MSSLADTQVEPGQVLAGKFRIERILGRGGMGVVVAATHVQLEEKVALKFLLPEALQNKEAVRRFEREARAAVKIKSEHVARVTDVGTLETGAPYMVMEFLNGMDLGEYLEQQGPLPVDEATDLLLQACEAIAEAHSLGIVHRDLKPANLFRIIASDGSPSVKVLDFGISKVTSGSDASMTQTSSMMGSPYYMSPEQMTSAKNVDHRTDIWALGIILHQLLTGTVPYQGETIPEICAQVLTSPPPRLGSLRPDVPEELERIVDRALSKNRDERFADVAEFAAAIAGFGNRYAQRHVERISKVLGVAPTARATTGQMASVGSGAASNLGSPGAVSHGGAGSRTGGRSTTGLSADEDERSATTLGGAAHTQLDYRPPTTSSKTPIFAVLALLLVGGGAWAVVSTLGGAGGAEPEGAAPVQKGEDTVSDLEPTPKGDVNAEGPSPSTQPSPAANPTAGAASPASAAPPKSAVSPSPRPSPSPQVAVKSTPSPKPQVAVKAAPAPTPKPTTAPAGILQTAPAPAPKPAPGPKPNLYLDRK